MGKYVDGGGFEWTKVCHTCDRNSEVSRGSVPSHAAQMGYSWCSGYGVTEREEPFKDLKRQREHDCPHFRSS